VPNPKGRPLKYLAEVEAAVAECVKTGNVPKSLKDFAKALRPGDESFVVTFCSSSSYKGYRERLKNLMIAAGGRNYLTVDEKLEQLESLLDRYERTGQKIQSIRALSKELGWGKSMIHTHPYSKLRARALKMCVSHGQKCYMTRVSQNTQANVTRLKAELERCERGEATHQTLASIARAADVPEWMFYRPRFADLSERARAIVGLAQIEQHIKVTSRPENPAPLVADEQWRADADAKLKEYAERKRPRRVTERA
jgi:hypothetical protein